MLDLDDFKRVNDIYGHAVGDQVLAELAVELRAAVRQSDAVCRTGGEEFAIIVPTAISPLPTCSRTALPSASHSRRSTQSAR